MTVLLTNDDGYQSDGLAAARDALLDGGPPRGRPWLPTDRAAAGRGQPPSVDPVRFDQVSERCDQPHLRLRRDTRRLHPRRTDERSRPRCRRSSSPASTRGQPRRRHHLLEHRRRRGRGCPARHRRASLSPSSPVTGASASSTATGYDWTPPALSPPSWPWLPAPDPLPAQDLRQRQRPRTAPTSAHARRSARSSRLPTRWTRARPERARARLLHLPRQRRGRPADPRRARHRLRGARDGAVR